MLALLVWLGRFAWRVCPVAWRHFSAIWLVIDFLPSRAWCNPWLACTHPAITWSETRFERLKWALHIQRVWLSERCFCVSFLNIRWYCNTCVTENDPFGKMGARNEGNEWLDVSSRVQSSFSMLNRWGCYTCQIPFQQFPWGNYKLSNLKISGDGSFEKSEIRGHVWFRIQSSTMFFVWCERKFHSIFGGLDWNSFSSTCEYLCKAGAAVCYFFF